MTKTTYDRRENEEVSETVVRAVSTATGTPPDHLQPLYEEIDPDALESIFTRSTGAGMETLTFLYEGYHVAVTRDSVTVEPFP